MPKHHIDHPMLMDYAAGSLAQPVAMLIATHIALCPECCGHVSALEAIGGALLDQIEPAELAEGSLEAALAKLDKVHRARPISARPPSPRAGSDALFADESILPEPLRSAVTQSSSRLQWRRRGIGLQELVLPSGNPKIRASLLKISPGASMPAHTHRGTELTLVLAGGFSDKTGHYQPGDVTLADSKTNHRPVADEQGECLCFAVIDGGIRFTGVLGRIANPMLGL